MIKLVLSDMDNTLIPLGQRVSPRTVEAIHAVLDAGVRFGPATGRDYVELSRLFRMHEECFMTGIFSNGKRVRLDGRYVSTTLIPHDQLVHIDQAIRGEKGMFLVCFPEETNLMNPAYGVGVSSAELAVFEARTVFNGGVVDEVLMRLNDALTAFPSILLALVLISILGPGNKYNVVIALGLVFIPSFARVTRTAFAALRDVNYVKSARLMGASSGRILVRQILPNTMQVLLPALTIGFNNAVLAEASMSYLGIGVTPPDASLGYMLSEAQGMLTSAPWYALGTGGTIVLLIFGVGLIGEGLQRRDGEVA